ncbi:MAG: hypothetical protein J6Y07_00595 [Alphaproteobacteria bacterium]|nr:hypothetical protein [Alphaproteobacteria bacterium]
MNESVQARYYSDKFEESEVLKGRTVPLRGLFLLIAGLAVSGLLYNGYQKLAKKTEPAKDNCVSVSAQKLYDEAKNAQNTYYLYAGIAK